MTTMERSIEVEVVRNITVIRFASVDLTEATFEGISDELNAILLERRPRRVVVDPVSIRRVDDLGLAMVQSFHDSVEELGGTAILCRLSQSVMSALSESGLHRLLHVRPSLNEAIWTF
jgi:anti-anti-sigma factor